MGYPDFLTEISPWWLDQRYKNGRLIAYGKILDSIYADARNAAINSRVFTCDPSALDAQGGNFNLARTPNEADEHFRQYLETAWSTVWPESGSDEGIINALHRIGMPNVNIVHWQDLMNRHVPFAFGGSYHIIAGVDFNGGVRYVNLFNQAATVIQQVSANSVFNIAVIASPGSVLITVTLHGDNLGHVLSTAHDVAKAFRTQKIGDTYGIYCDAMGTGLSHAGAGTVDLDYPIYTHFFIEIDGPNAFTGPLLWDGNPDNLPLVPVHTGTGADFHAITGVYGEFLLIVGDNGNILSWDGTTLNPVVSGTINNLLAISMVGVGSGLIVGQNGEGLRLIAGVPTPSATGTANNLNCCFLSNSNNGFAAGDSGTVLQMTAGVWGAASFPAAPMINWHGMIGFAANNVWIVGDTNTVAHWDGTNFTVVTSPVGAGNLMTIWGDSSSDLWVGDDGGNLYHWNGAAWGSAVTTDNANAIRGSDGANPNVVYFVGDAGKLVEFTGGPTNPLPLQNSGTSQNLFGVWVGADNQDLWVVGANGTVLRRINAQLTPLTIPTGPSLFAVWCNTVNDAWAVGAQGRVMHWDGTSWSDFAPIPLLDTTVQCFWSLDGSEIWLVGSDGLIARRNTLLGDFWFDISFDTTETFYGVSGSSFSDIWAVGSNGIIVHWDGAEWLAVPSETTNTLYSVVAVSPTLAYCVGSGGIILKWDGGTWKPQHSPTTHDLFGVTIATDPIAVGAHGTIVRSVGGVIDWTLDASPVINDLHSVAQQLGNTAVAVGNIGTVLEFDGVSWNVIVSGTSQNLYNVTTYGTRITAVGAAGTIIHFNGAVWATQASGVTYDMYAVWANSDLDGLAGGQDTPILSWNGAAWVTDPFDTGLQNIPTLNAIFALAIDDMWVVGNRGTVLHWDGIKFTKQFLPTNAVLNDIWASGDNDIWAVGEIFTEGQVWHFDGISWTLSFTVPTGFVESVWGTGINQIWIGGESGPGVGAIWHFDGFTWTLSTIPVSPPIGKIRGWDGQHIWAVSDGTVLFFDGLTWSTFTVPADLGISLLHGLAVTSQTTFYATSSAGIVYYWDGFQYQEYVYPTLFRLEDIGFAAPGVIFVVGFDISNHGVILQLTPNVANNVWDGGGLWDFGITDNILLSAIIDMIRKFKASGTSCRFLKINLAGSWVTVPVGELVEIDINGNYITKPPTYLTSWVE
jgi:hypothetical protein